ncbi:S-adenosyl-L-methionine-dependent methyltransferase [Coniella lustricola]|uniref:Ubiquinone biosynthesis O-methyltransferase, mitochondrial n=1 Tax=Coniella lustricola TaxID=2025994 RepID=A0A2T3AM17_9PEZI|nr:S-adenosyl-L-methionine-dependent methyltransferase [Coniella lustricola]
MAPSRAPAAVLRQITHRRPSLSASVPPSPPPAPSASSSSESAYTSVNASEVAHFNSLAAEWWDAHGSSRILHLMNPLRHDFIRACHATQPSPLPPNRKLSYLDVGCGGGIFAESAARLATTASVTAVDPTPEVLKVARAHAARDPSLASKLQYISGTIETLPLPSSSEAKYDIVSLFEVIEHVDKPADFLDRCGDFVKPGGWLVMSTIARTWTSWFTTNFMAEDVLRIVPKGTHDWHKYINADELKRFFAQRPAWSAPRIMGVVYVPGLGWKEVSGSEAVGNYFLAVRKAET